MIELSDLHKAAKRLGLEGITIEKRENEMSFIMQGHEVLRVKQNNREERPHPKGWFYYYIPRIEFPGKLKIFYRCLKHSGYEGIYVKA